MRGFIFGFGVVMLVLIGLGFVFGIAMSVAVLIEEMKDDKAEREYMKRTDPRGRGD